VGGTWASAQEDSPVVQQARGGECPDLDSKEKGIRISVRSVHPCMEAQLTIAS
jgi:hypothetical protein